MINMETIEIDNNKENEVENITNFLGKLHYCEKEYLKTKLLITQDFLLFKIEEENKEFFLSYKDLGFFALNEEDGFIMMNTQSDDSFYKFYPDNKADTQNIYDTINNFNLAHPDEEFEGEPSGNNELYTAESFK
jgi:hypothetical protein